jgi:methionine-rich copper-binding protein CopC
MDIRRAGFFVFRRVRSFFSGGRVLVGLFLVLLFIGGFASPGVGRAALARDAYQASLLSVSAPSKLAPGEMGQIRVEFRNIGTASWLSTGKNFVSLYRWNPVTKLEMVSQLATPAWETTSRPLRLPVAKVSPNTSVVMNVPIQAPLTAGTYTETFILTAEDLAWMKYGQVTITLVVGQAAQTQAVSSAPSSLPVLSTPVFAPSASAVSLASSSGDWAAELVEKSGAEWQLDPDGTANVTLTYKNTGTKTWTRDSAGFLSLYATDGSKERVSVFAGSLWSGNAAARLKEREVRPGQTGTFTFQIRAPKTAGSYKETFMLAAEHVAWVQGSSVTLPIHVIPSQTFDFVASGLPDTTPLPTTVNTTPDPSSSASKIRRTATLLLRSIQAATLLGNGRQEVQVGFKNTSDVTWNSRALRLKGMVPAINARWASVRDDSWSSTAEPVRKIGDVKPGEIAFLTFKVKAPAKKGKYTVSFALYADGEPVQGGDIDIPITVTADGYIEPEPVLPPTPTVVTQPNAPIAAPLISFPPVDPVPLSGDPSSLPAEPMIRVGIFRTTDDQMVIRAMQVPVVSSKDHQKAVQGQPEGPR